ncbi:MAG TPA: proton-conducting transporter membrane subunit, partial [Elusimicrobiota bacterium]|nr:proton-conducting transporter membrane subunit [Elusimicrobiota bacterium]
YSSVEHMGILALGIGIGGMGWYGAMLHAVNHSLAKAMLFFVAGNLIAAYQSKAVEDVRGAAAMAPASGWLWLAGLFPIGGSPPFGLFLSEWIILKAVLDGGRYGLAALYLLLLGMIFVAMASAMLPMVQGQPPARPGKTAQPESWLSILPPAALAILVLALGVAIPHPVGNALAAAAKMLEVIR